MAAKHTAWGLFTFFILVSGACAQEWHQMDTPERIRSGLEANATRVYQLKPTSQPRPLPPAAPSDFTQKLTADGQSYVGNAVSAMVLDNGQLVFELYNQGGGSSALANAFSMTKSMTSLAVGEALCAGKIKSLDQLVSDL